MRTLTSPAQPLILNDVFENVFSLYRRRFLMLFGIVAVAQVPMIVLQLLLLLTLGQGLPDDSSALVRRLLAGAPPDLPLDRLMLFVAGSLALSLLQGMLVSQLVAGALTNVIVRQHMREPLSVAGAYRLGWRRATALLGAGTASSLLGTLIAGAGLLAAWATASSLTGGDLASLRDPGTAALVGTALLAIGGGTAALLVGVLIRFLFFPQTVVVEDVGALEGMRRSWRLTGSALLRVLGSVALVWMLILIATGIPTACINFGVQFMFPRPVEDLFVRQVTSLFVSNIVQMAALPLQLSAYTMLYFDLRRRREGHAQGYE